MDKKTQMKYESQADIMKALAHPTRLFVVNELSKGELCVGKITEMVGVDTSTISKHLLILKNAGIVNNEKRGTTVYYKLKMPCVLNFITCIKKVQETKYKEQMQLIE